jgi:hypothetical protein
LLASASCEADRLKPTSGDRAPEVSISGSELTRSFARHGDHYVSPILDAPDLATVAGLMVDVARPEAEARFEARGIDRYGSYGPWVPAGVTWSEAELRVLRAPLGVAAAGVELRLPAADAAEVRFVVYSAVVPMPPVAERPIGVVDRMQIGTSRSGLSAALAAEGVKSRADWGARATQCSTTDPVKTRMAVHHTVTPPTSSNGYEARIRQIQAFHMDTRGWCDVGYHFLVTTDGTIWEAREAQYLGAHVADNNSNNVGTSFIGCFHPGDPTCEQAEFQPTTPPDPMIQGGGRFLGLLSIEYGIAVNETNVKGHRDHTGAQTSCPGDALYAKLADLRAIANGVTPPPPPAKGTVNGVVWDLSITPGPSDPGNVRLTGATVTCSNGEQVTVRASDAFWSFELDPGLYTFTAESAGFASASRELMVTLGDVTWGSIGLAPEPQAVQLILDVSDSEAGAPIEGAAVVLDMIGTKLTGADGRVVFDVMPGLGRIAVSAEGYEPYESPVDFTNPAGTTLAIGLVKVMVEEPPPVDPPPVDPPPVDPPAVDPPAKEPAEDGGCGCAASRSEASPALAWLALALLVARKRR